MKLASNRSGNLFSEVGSAELGVFTYELRCDIPEVNKCINTVAITAD